jgi:restriction endonuclease S subunit
MLDVQDSLEFDIARQYLMAYPVEELAKHDQLATLRKIIESGARYPRCKLDELIEPKYERLRKEDYSGQFDIVEKIAFADGSIHFREFPETGMDLYIADRGDLITSKINLHQGAVALAPRRLVCSTHYQVYRPKTPDCRADYICHMLRSPQFLAQLMEQKNKGIKNEQGSDFLCGFEVPLPPPEIQQTIARQFDELVSVAAACRIIQSNFAIVLPDFAKDKLRPLKEAVLETRNGWSPTCNGGEVPVLTLSCLKRGRIDPTERKYTSASRRDIEKFYVHEGDFFYSRGNTPELVALAGISGPMEDNVVFPDLLTRVIFDRAKILPEFAALLFNSTYGREYFGRVPQGASPSMVKVSQEYMGDFRVPYMQDIHTQEVLVAAVRQNLDALSAVGQLQDDTQKQLRRILDETWG